MTNMSIIRQPRCCGSHSFRRALRDPRQWGGEGARGGIIHDRTEPVYCSRAGKHSIAWHGIAPSRTRAPPVEEHTVDSIRQLHPRVLFRKPAHANAHGHAH